MRLAQNRSDEISAGPIEACAFEVFSGEWIV
jgi:hypothetical protein